MLMRQSKCTATAAICAVLVVAFHSIAIFSAVPGFISYQGRITTPTGLPVADGAYLVKFQIYDNAVGGSVLWNSNYQSVQVESGLYTYILGQDVAFPDGLFTGANRWLGITIGADPELAPRKQLLATGYAFVSQNADSVNWGGIKNLPAGFSDGVDDNSGGDITAVNTSGGLTGGSTSGAANISIVGGGVTSSHIGDGQITNADINNSAPIAAAKISGTAFTLSGTQTVTGAKTFSGQVSFGDSSMRVDNTGVNIGKNVFGTTDKVLSVSRDFNIGSQRTGISSEVTNAGNGTLFGLTSSVEAISPSTSPCYGISTSAYSDGLRVGLSAYVQANTITPRSGTGYGVKSGVEYGGEDYGVHGVAYSSDEGYGVYGQARLALGFGVGVYGFGYENFSSAYGVYGTTTTNNSHGFGVYGRAQGNDGNGYGVYGSVVANGGSNWAGYFSGDVNVTGTIYTPAKLTRIDHPSDPENKYLLFSSVDSPEMLNTYCGNVILNAEGEATVLLPESFARVCKDYRYQLTCIGGYAPVYIAQEVTDSEFRIAGGKDGLKVSWQVIALRDDNFARTFPMSSEKAKRPDELGKYLHPAAFGLDETRGVDYEHNRPIGKQSNLQPPDGRP